MATVGDHELGATQSGLLQDPLGVGTSYRPESIAELYLATWAPSHSAYVRWVRSLGHYVTVKKALTPSIVLEALTTDQPIGFFHPAEDGSTHILACDIDYEDGWAPVLAIGRAFREADIPALVERSRRSGHVWARIDGRVDVATAWRACRAAIVGAGLDPDDPKIETRPLMSHASGLGHSLRPPLMRHPVTKKRWPLVDPLAERPVHDDTVASMLLETATTEASEAAVRTLAERHPLPQAPKRSLHHRTGGVGYISDFNRQVGVSAVLQHEFALERAAPGRNVRCPMHDDRTPSLSIACDDRRAWCHSPDCAFHAGSRGVDAWDIVQLARGGPA